MGRAHYRRRRSSPLRSRASMRTLASSEKPPPCSHSHIAAVASRAGRVYVADGSHYFSRPGPRVVDSLEILAYTLHPEVHPLPIGLPRPVQVNIPASAPSIGLSRCLHDITPRAALLELGQGQRLDLARPPATAGCGSRGLADHLQRNRGPCGHACRPTRAGRSPGLGSRITPLASPPAVALRSWPICRAASIHVANAESSILSALAGRCSVTRSRCRWAKPSAAMGSASWI
jgi:ABC-type Fe3+-hydroxamate transport system, periplasmic component